MGQEYFINSEELESKVRKLLPTQGGAGAGFDLSASTQIVPIIDLTESAEGSSLRVDLQTALDGASTSFGFGNATNTVLVTTTGFFRVIGTFSQKQSGGLVQNNFNLFDGATANNIWGADTVDNSNIGTIIVPFDFICFIGAGYSLRATASANARLTGSTRQIASIDGTLTNPLNF